MAAFLTVLISPGISASLLHVFHEPFFPVAIRKEDTTKYVFIKCFALQENMYRTVIQKCCGPCRRFRQKCRLSADAGNPGIRVCRNRNGYAGSPAGESKTAFVPVKKRPCTDQSHGV